ncbi:DUF6461 domain-containing protein [Streptosporangium roseum]|uniref:DUF6461 domain-containing protein n=1 Tax=Streptosporangium roseum TaxID=2001 RepID=UPI003329C1A3
MDRRRKDPARVPVPGRLLSGDAGRTRTDHGSDRLPPPTAHRPHGGPAFLLAERLIGITLAPQLLEKSTYLCGVVPNPR